MGAVMDYAMRGFDLEAFAVPRRQCKVSRMTQTTMMVDPGSYVMAQVQVQNTDNGGVYDAYSVKVSRLIGSETMVKWLHIKGAYLVPDFDPLKRNYTVFLDIGQDIVKFTFQRLDNGQVISLVSHPEQPEAQAGKRRLFSAAPPQSRATWHVTPLRHLSDEKIAATDLGPPIGDVQHLPSTLLTTIDVGHLRMVELAVTSADKSAADKYSFTVKRPFCPEERRFFDGKAKVCTDICNEGYFGNSATGRCSSCLQDHCAVCDSAKACSLCLDGFAMANGRCVAAVSSVAELGSISEAEATVEKYGRKHRMLVLGGALVVTVALVTCTALLCCSRSGRQRPRLLDSDDELS